MTSPSTRDELVAALREAGHAMAAADIAAGTPVEWVRDVLATPVFSDGDEALLKPAVDLIDAYLKGASGMTSPPIIGDDEAKRIAGRVGRRWIGPASIAMLRFERTGEVGKTLVKLAAHLEKEPPKRKAATSPDTVALLAYVAHHGERPPQPNWSDGEAGTP